LGILLSFLLRWIALIRFGPTKARKATGTATACPAGRFWTRPYSDAPAKAQPL